MMDILRDPVWQFIGVILAVVAIIISIALYRRQRRHKALSYEIISRIPLLGMEEEIKGNLQILFNGKPVQQVHLIVVKIINSGNMPIVFTDYERPISLSFGEKAQILTAEVAETNPDSLRAAAEIEGKKVVLTPILLNQEDSITLKMLVNEFSEQITVNGRVVGVKDICESVEKLFSSIALTVSGLALVLIAVIGFFQVTISHPLRWIFWLSLILGYLMMVTGLFLRPSYRKILLAMLKS